MKTKQLCIASAFVALSCITHITHAAQGQESLLNAQIAISWSGPVDEFGQLLAQRLGVPYQVTCPVNAQPTLVIEQSAAATVAAALQAANSQLQGQALELSSSSLERGCMSASTTPSADRTVTAVQAAGAIPPAPPLAPSARSYVLREGEAVHEQLQAWAKAEGWKLIWYPPVSWRVIADSTHSHADAAGAIEAVVSILRNEGKQLLLSTAAANTLMEITSTDITAESTDHEN